MSALPRRRRVASAGAELAVSEHGDPSRRPTVLLAHGYPDTGAVWDELVELLAPRFHVAVFDMRGMGASTAPRAPRAFALERLVEDLRAVADAVGGGRPVHLVGHDWGGMAAWDGIARGTLGASLASYTAVAAPSLDHMGRRLEAALRRRSRPALVAAAGQGLRSWYVAAFRLPLLPELVWRRLAARRFGAMLQRTEGIAPRPGHPAETLARDAVTGLALYRTNVARRLRRPAPLASGLPVQLVVPTRDRYISPWAYQDLEAVVPGLRRREIAAGHWVQRSHPDEIARLVSELVDGR